MKWNPKEKRKLKIQNNQKREKEGREKKTKNNQMLVQKDSILSNMSHFKVLLVDKFEVIKLYCEAK